MGFDFTPEEQAHLKNLEALLDAMQDRSADPSTSITAREALETQMNLLGAQVETLEACGFGRDTVDIQAAAGSLSPAMKQLDTLKKELDKVKSGIKDFTTIATLIGNAITTGTSVLG